ncbi:hypothetical protein CLOL250_02077 [Clostridium sp. L2-50]|nr:hypothetical protein CLOL250_02077 [Clostridium sp. L2-50]
MFESKGRVGTGAFTNQACASNRNRNESIDHPPAVG